MLSPFGCTYAVVGFLTPAGAAWIEIKAAAVTVYSYVILAEGHVLISKEEISFGVAWVNGNGLMEEFDGFLVLTNDRFLNSLLEQRLALFGLGGDDER